MTTSRTLYSRRSAIKTFSVGALALGAALKTPVRLGAESSQETSGAQALGIVGTAPYTLPKLPYAFDALEPAIDARTMEIHYTKHHQAYVTNANALLEGHPDLAALTAAELLADDLSRVPESIRTGLRNNLGGHVNHSFFWPLLSAGPADYRAGKLRRAIVAEFGSLAAFQERFAQAANTRFGSGWAWLLVRDGKLLVESTANQDSPLMNGTHPIIGLDVWEHAYYLHYQNRRADYVKAFWTLLNWNQAEANFASATAA